MAINSFWLVNPSIGLCCQSFACNSVFIACCCFFMGCVFVISHTVFVTALANFVACRVGSVNIGVKVFRVLSFW